METLKCIKKRCSVRKFSKKEVSRKDLIKILEAGNQAPCAGNIQSWQFIILRDKSVITKVASTTLRPEVFDNVSAVVVVCSKTGRVTSDFKERGELYAAQNTAAAIENMLLAATDLGIDSLWVGSLAEEKAGTILEIPDGIDIHALVVLGYRKERRIKVGKNPLANKVFYDAWGSTKDVKILPVYKQLKRLKKKLHEAAIKAICLKCSRKKKVIMKEPYLTTTKNERKLVKGKCPNCGTTVCRFVKEDFEL